MVSGRLTLALDAMGGDHAPAAVLKGANIAAERYSDLHFLLFGDEAKITPVLKRLKALRDRAEIIHTEHVISSEEKPSAALRSGKGSSMVLALQAVKDGKAQGVVSAGNTGALLAWSKIMLRTLPGIHRPAFASFFPTMRGESIMLDLGANTECDARNLVQFAVMGEAFARSALGLEQPLVGLLNVGAEDMKGHEDLREAAQVLKNAHLPLEFHGFIEGNHIPEGVVDVVVTDGFTGNIALKTAEGTAKLCYHFLRQSFRHSLMSILGYIFARGGLKKLRMRMDPRRYNGAVFLGLNHIVVKSHGGSDAISFSTAINLARDMMTQNMIDMIRHDIESLQATSKTETKTETESDSPSESLSQSA